MDYDVHLAEVHPTPTAVVRGRVGPDEVGGFVGVAFSEVVAALDQQGLLPTGPPFCRYVVRDGRFDVEAGFPAPDAVTDAGRVVRSELPGGTTATTVHSGPYDEVAAAYTAATEWLADHGLTSSGAPWECYLDEPDVPRPRTEVFVPCTASDHGPVAAR